MLHLILRFVSLVLLVPTALAAEPPAAGSAPVIGACESGLPADADERSRRITCTIPDEYREAVTMAEIMGVMVRRHDMAAWQTTDALNSRGQLAKAGQRAGGNGWITEEAADRIQVRYMAEKNGASTAFASASLRFEPFGVVDARMLEPAGPATERELRLLKARAIAQEAPGLFTCTKATPNVVMTEFEGADGVPRILVFFMSAWTESTAPLGGYHMVRVDAQGSQVIDVFSQTKACPAAGTPREVAKFRALVVSHLTTPTPTLFHVFMSLQYRKPMYVSTVENGLTWLVDNGRISLVRATDAAPAPATSSAQ